MSETESEPFSGMSEPLKIEESSKEGGREAAGAPSMDTFFSLKQEINDPQAALFEPKEQESKPREEEEEKEGEGEKDEGGRQPEEEGDQGSEHQAKEKEKEKEKEMEKEPFSFSSEGFNFSINEPARSSTSYSLSHSELRKRGFPEKERIPKLLKTETDSSRAFGSASRPFQSTSPPSSSSSSSSAPSSSAPSSSSSSSTEEDNSPFECNICFEMATNPVVSLCGHLYCWPCIHKWIQSQEVPLCPVCKAGIGKEKVIPVYSRGGERKDPRKEETENVPNRPSGQRPQPERQAHFNYYDPFANAFFPRQGAGNGAHFQFSAGIGFFPSMFGLQFNFPGPMEQINDRMTPEENRQALLSRIFMIFGVLILFMLLFS